LGLPTVIILKAKEERCRSSFQSQIGYKIRK